jgi:hypothetical protein
MFDKMSHFLKMKMSMRNTRRNISDVSATPSGIRREWYVCIFQIDIVWGAQNETFVMLI